MLQILSLCQLPNSQTPSHISLLFTSHLSNWWPVRGQQATAAAFPGPYFCPGCKGTPLSVVQPVQWDGSQRVAVCPCRVWPMQCVTQGLHHLQSPATPNLDTLCNRMLWHLPLPPVESSPMQVNIRGRPQWQVWFGQEG